ncbi:MAG: HAD family phosphatase [Candidatus Microsaccharimonas sp.]
MIKAIVFDCFGVLAQEGWHPFRDKYLASDPAKLQQARDLLKASGNGFISHQDFIEGLAELVGMSFEDTRRHVENNPPNEELLDFIKDELNDYKIGMLSNVSGNRLDQLLTPEQLQLFDVICLSYDMGVSKPNKEAYEIVIEKLGVKPEECIFTDDVPEFCEGAEKVGMRPILFTTTAEFIKDLRALQQIDRATQTD